MKKTKPYLPQATFEQVLSYNPADPATFTPSPIVNAVADALYETHLIESGELAAYLEVDRLKLNHALSLDLGMTLIEVIHQYRLHQIQGYVEQHPDEKLEDVAHACGYASAGSLWRFMQRKVGTTARGEKSTAGPENFNEMLKALRKRADSIK